MKDTFSNEADNQVHVELELLDEADLELEKCILTATTETQRSVCLEKALSDDKYKNYLAMY